MQENIRIIGNAECEYSSDAESFYQGYWSPGETISSCTRNKNKNILDHYFPDEIKNKCVVELGVGGEGGIIVDLKDTNRVFGVDASRSAAENCKRLGVEVIQLNLDASTLPFDDGSVDVVFGFEVFEHLSSPQFVVEEVYRILREGGVLLLTTPNPIIHHWPRLFYPQLFEKKSFREFLMINKFYIREQANIGSNIYSKCGCRNIDEAWSWTWYCEKTGADQAELLFKYGRYFWNQKDSTGIRQRPMEAIDLFRKSYTLNPELIKAKLMLTCALVYRAINGETEEFRDHLAFANDWIRRNQYPESLHALGYLLMTDLELQRHGRHLLGEKEFGNLLKELDRYEIVEDLVSVIRQEMAEIECLKVRSDGRLKRRRKESGSCQN